MFASANKFCGCWLKKFWSIRKALPFATPSRFRKHKRVLPRADRQRLKPCLRRPLNHQVIYCVRGVVSPVLANLYMNRFLKYWRMSGQKERLQAQVVNYADDFVILSRGKAGQALNWTRGVMTKLGLTLNEAKTCIKEARKESFSFLGYTFGPHHYRKDGHWYLGASPSKKSVARLRGKVGDLLKPSNVAPWPEVRDKLNSMLQGWAAYFSYGTRLMAYRAVDNYVLDRVRHFLKRRHKVPSRGTIRYSDDVVFGELGILRLRHVHVGALPSASKRNQSESRMPEMGTSGCATRKCRCVQWEIDPPR